MRPNLQKSRLPLAFLLLAVAPLSASTTTTLALHASGPDSIVSVDLPADAASVLDSIRKDVAQHPADYVTFETQIAARRFLAQHTNALPETDRTMLARGILGYWQGKTLAVVPSLSISQHTASAR